MSYFGEEGWLVDEMIVWLVREERGSWLRFWGELRVGFWGGSWGLCRNCLLPRELEDVESRSRICCGRRLC